ncbi:MAG: type III polyketide synthase [Alphaproteobacteria bacterium]|nr:type III polyketide synthase [Alphaproteobacteria bacterium]
MTTAVHLLALETAVPPYRVTQAEARAAARSVLAPAWPDYERYDSVFDSSGVTRRFFARPLDWYAGNPGWPERQGVFLEVASTLLDDVAARALAAAGLTAEGVDQVVCVSTTGFPTPTLEARLIHRLGLPARTRRTPVFGWGCAGGALGLGRAAELARAAPGEVVLLLVVELCSLAFRADPEPVNVVGAALFGDAAVAAVLRAGDGDDVGPRIVGSGEHTWPDTLDIMGWRIDPTGFGLELRRDLPGFVDRELRTVVDGFLDRQGAPLDSFAGVVAHPGGPKVLDATARALDLPAEALAVSRAVLAEYGNTSATSVLLVLDRVRRAGTAGRHLLLALGPGFSAGFVVLEL